MFKMLSGKNDFKIIERERESEREKKKKSISAYDKNNSALIPDFNIF